MPRQIIDTESSRPRYVRRLAVTYAVWIIVLALLAYGAYVLWVHHQASRGGNAPSARVSWEPRITTPADSRGGPKESPCFVA